MTKDRLIAKLLALENASEMIRGHGEEGGIEEDDWPIDVDIYLSECKKLAKQLTAKAEKIKIKINTWKTNQ